MAFTTWAAELLRFKNALAERNVEYFFLQATENSREMRTQYTKLGNITEFLEWLEFKAAEEVGGLSAGEIPTAIGGY
jgi:hypothetical protein